MNRTKTLDYKASFHILDRRSTRYGLYDDSSGNEKMRRSSTARNLLRKSTKGGGSKKRLFYIEDVLGLFEQDEEGKMIIIKRKGAHNPLSKSLSVQ